MISVFAKIRSLLRPDADRTYAADVKPLMDFSTIDFEKVKKDLAIERRAAERAARNEPPSDTVGLDEVELEIVGAVSTLRNEGYENYSKQVSAYDGRLARLDLRTIVPEIKNGLHDAEADFNAEVQKDTNYIFAKTGEVLATRTAYRAFRKKNDLERLPELEKNPQLSVAILILIFLAETFANSGFFSATHPGGLLGAAFEASAISLINLATGFVLGVFALRYVRLPSFFWRASMSIAVLALVALAVVFNFFAAHYRDAFALVPPEADEFMLKASQTAMNTLIQSKFVLQGFQSYLMVLVGLFVVLYATYKGVSWLDPFPGYGAVYKRHQARLAEYLGLIDDRVRNLQDRKDRAIDELRESITDIRRRDQEYGIVISERTRLTHRYNAYLESLQRAIEALLQTYRSENRSKRTTAPPKTFNEPWKANWASEAVLNDATVEERKKAVDVLLEAIATSQTRLLDAFNDALKAYDRLRDIDKQADEHVPA